jgi:1-acyl-sn-glycerol-3-phosphate acyltransferase
MIQWLRSLLFYVFIFPYITVCASIVLLSIPFTSRKQRYKLAQFWSWTSVWVLSKLCGVQYRVIGQHNIPQNLDAGLIILGKHQSAWETVAYPSIFPRELCFVFKRELLFLPFFGWALASFEMIHINRGDREKARAAVNVQGKAVLAEGRWIVIFPEGTRTPRGSNKPYRKGGVRLAINTQTHILPVAQNSGSVWPRNSILKFPGLITVSIGPVISVAGKTEEEIQREVEDWIETEMRRLDSSAYR